MSLQDRILDDLKTAMRTGDVERRGALRMLRAAIQSEEIEIQRTRAEAQLAEAGEEGQLAPIERRPLDDAEAVGVVERMVKRHQDSISEFRKGNRADLIAREQAQLNTISGYLPYKLWGRAEIEARVRELIAETGATGRTGIAKLMPLLSAAPRGKADMNEVRQVAQELLGA